LGHDELWKKSACNHQSLIRTETEELSGLMGSVPLMMQAPSNSGIPIWTPHSLSALRTKENKMSSSRLVELLKIKVFFYPHHYNSPSLEKTWLQFAYSKIQHYNFISSPSIPFSTSAAYKAHCQPRISTGMYTGVSPASFHEPARGRLTSPRCAHVAVPRASASPCPNLRSRHCSGYRGHERRGP
jgi:hypothetical protein